MSFKKVNGLKKLKDIHIKHTVLGLVTQSCPTLCDPMNLSPPGSSVHGDSPGKNTGVGCRALFQGFFPTQESNPDLPHCRRILNHLSHKGSPLSCRLEPNSTLSSMFHSHPRTVAFPVYLNSVGACWCVLSILKFQDRVLKKYLFNLWIAGLQNFIAFWFENLRIWGRRKCRN